MVSTSARVPKVGEFVRSQGKLVEVRDVTPPVEKVEYWIFEVNEARVELRCHGKLINRYSTFNDFYGEGTCLDFAKKEAAKLLESLGITDPAASDLELVVIKSTFQVRRERTNGITFYDAAFVGFNDVRGGIDIELPQPMESVVWSSKQPTQPTVEAN